MTMSQAVKSFFVFILLQFHYSVFNFWFLFICHLYYIYHFLHSGIYVFVKIFKICFCFEYCFYSFHLILSYKYVDIAHLALYILHTCIHIFHIFVLCFLLTTFGHIFYFINSLFSCNSSAINIVNWNFYSKHYMFRFRIMSFKMLFVYL